MKNKTFQKQLLVVLQVNSLSFMISKKDKRQQQQWQHLQSALLSCSAYGVTNKTQVKAITTGSVFSNHLQSLISDLEPIFVTMTRINTQKPDPRSVLLCDYKSEWWSVLFFIIHYKLQCALNHINKSGSPSWGSGCSLREAVYIFFLKQK